MSRSDDSARLPHNANKTMMMMNEICYPAVAWECNRAAPTPFYTQVP